MPAGGRGAVMAKPSTGLSMEFGGCGNQAPTTATVNALANDIIVVLTPNRTAGSTTVTAATMSGTATLSAGTQIGADTIYDGAGTSRGNFQVDWYLVTGGGTVILGTDGTKTPIIARIRGLNTTTPFSSTSVQGNAASATVISFLLTDCNFAMLVTAADAGTDVTSWTPGGGNGFVAAYMSVDANMTAAGYANHQFAFTAATPQTGLVGTASGSPTVSGGSGVFLAILNPA